MRTVTKEKFGAIMNKSIHLGECPKCGAGGGEILVRMPWYGKFGVCIRCQYCNYETKTRGITSPMFDKNRIGTPVIDKSLLRGIHTAINDWKVGADNG